MLDKNILLNNEYSAEMEKKINKLMAEVKIKKSRKVNNDNYDFMEYHVIYNEISWVTIYQGLSGSWYRTHIQKDRHNWYWTIRYVNNDKYKYEEFKYLQDAKKRALKIVKLEVIRDVKDEYSA